MAAESANETASETRPPTGPAQDAGRYSRQVLFVGIGSEGQRRIRVAHVGIIGCGATGAATANLLVRAGIGTLTLVDRDYVEESNLQRQVLFDEADARECLPKAEAARRKLAAINHDVVLRTHIADLTPANISTLLATVTCCWTRPTTTKPAT